MKAPIVFWPLYALKVPIVSQPSYEYATLNRGPKSKLYLGLYVHRRPNFITPEPSYALKAQLYIVSRPSYTLKAQWYFGLHINMQ